jgi:hypothetical protein
VSVPGDFGKKKETDIKRFYFASQVTPSGDSVQYDELSGEAHGKVYWNLVQQKEQGEWHVNFGPDSEYYGKIA